MRETMLASLKALVSVSFFLSQMLRCWRIPIESAREKKANPWRSGWQTLLDAADGWPLEIVNHSLFCFSFIVRVDFCEPTSTGTCRESHRISIQHKPFFFNLFIEALLGQSIFQESSAIRGVIPKWITPSGAESRWATAASAINYARIPGILQEGQWLASLSCVALRLSPTESFLFVSPASPHLDWVTPSWNDFELTSLGFNRILPDIT